MGGDQEQCRFASWQFVVETEQGPLIVLNARWKRTEIRDPITNAVVGHRVEVQGSIPAMFDEDIAELGQQIVTIRSPIDLMGLVCVVTQIECELVQRKRNDRIPRSISMTLVVHNRTAMTVLPDADQVQTDDDIALKYHSLIQRFVRNPGIDYAALWDQLHFLGERARKVVVKQVQMQHADWMVHKERLRRQRELIEREREEEKAREILRKKRELEEARQALAESYDDADFERRQRRINLDG